MRVLIIALPRTGSTSLLYNISKERDLRPIFEPFDWSGRFLYNDDMDNVVVKTIIYQHPNNIELSKKFDEVILLNRRNFNDHLESYSYLYHNKPLGYHSAKPYRYISPPADVIKEAEKLLIKMSENLKYLSDTLNIPIQYYEDLFNPESEGRLRLDLSNKKSII
jgi:hypothetical protein